MTNVAVIVLDTLRKDAFDRHFDWLPGRRFERAYSTANWTVPAHASLFSGRYASAVGVDAKHQPWDWDGPDLASVLGEAGYRTRGLSANQNVSAKGRWDRGFDEFVNPSGLYFRDGTVLDWEEFLSTTEATGARLYLQAVRACFTEDCATIPSLRAGFGYYRGGLRAASGDDDFGAQAAIDILEEWTFGDEEFLYVNLMETHTPYSPPAGYPGAGRSVSVDIAHSLGLEAAPPDVETVYDGAARYLSDATRTLYETIEPDFDHVIFLADHGEMLGENGRYNHTYGLDPEIVHVPLVVTGLEEDEGDWDEREKGGHDPIAADGTPRSLLDVYPTVLDLAGIEPPGTVDGASLLGPPAPEPYLAEYRGLLYKAVERLEENGVDAGTIERFEAPLVAAVLEEGYVYETDDGIGYVSASDDGIKYVSGTGEDLGGTGAVEGGPADALARATRRLERASTVEGAEGRATDIPERHLEQLGYL